MGLNSNLFINRSWYSSDIASFQNDPDEQAFAKLCRRSEFPVLQTQKEAWISQLQILREALSGVTGKLYLEFEIPRMGRRVDAVVLVKNLVLAIEFKNDAREYLESDIDQAYDYALDLKYFHEASHKLPVVPILVATKAKAEPYFLRPHARVQGLYKTICSNCDDFSLLVKRLINDLATDSIDPDLWESSRYCPTPTIVEAARALYAGHGVEDISRNEAGVLNLKETTAQISQIIDESRSLGQKAICFVTGVPGAGKTLVGLNIATKYSDPNSGLHSVFLSGNGPLVKILREALARDNIRRESAKRKKLRKLEAMISVKAFIQNVHNFRDEYRQDPSRPPIDRIAIFDEAQRAWNLEQTSFFMRRKKGVAGFNVSEPEFLISCMDRHRDWTTIICLVGGGQEINTGEAGIAEWIKATQKPPYDKWHLYISPALTDSEYGAGKILEEITRRENVHYMEELHLAVSMRSFRAEKVSDFVKLLLDLEAGKAKEIFKEIETNYPICLTRNLDNAKQWLRKQASGNERFGIMVSSQAERLKPYAIDVRSPVDPVKWFLNDKNDVRSSYYLEDVATEFHVQGLELDWACVSWDGDFRYAQKDWQHFSFRGTRWQNIKQESRKTYLKNAYRVLLTRARQGMAIFVPEGDASDPTRDPTYYNSTFAYLKSIGLPEL